MRFLQRRSVAVGFAGVALLWSVGCGAPTTAADGGGRADLSPLDAAHESGAADRPSTVDASDASDAVTCVTVGSRPAASSNGSEATRGRSAEAMAAASG